MTNRTKLALALLALGQLTCNQAILTAPQDAALTLIANPEFIPANGGVSVISALVNLKDGRPVADGTVVQFFTNLGKIDEQGKTNDGVARVNLVSDARSGKATVTAVSGGVSKTQDVNIGGVLPKQIILTADPQRLVDRRASHIVATLLDENGNPVANVGVIFTVTGKGVTPSPSPAPTPPPAEQELMDSRGNPVFTNNDGRAEDFMRTSFPFGSTQRTVAVTVTVLGAGTLTKSVDVVIN